MVIQGTHLWGLLQRLQEPHADSQGQRWEESEAVFIRLSPPGPGCLQHDIPAYILLLQTWPTQPRLRAT